MAKQDEALLEIAEKLDDLTVTVNERFDAIANRIDALVRGLTLMSETQATHSDMLTEIMTMCSVDPGDSPDLSDVLDRIASVMEQQTEEMKSIDNHLAHLGGTIEQSVTRGMVRVMEQQSAINSGLVDEDGVIVDDDED